jgi:lysozyme
MHHLYLERIKSFEGFTPVAKPDYAQHSNGFGTKALYPGERIDRGEAERRFTQEIARARTFVERHVPNLDTGTKAALTSLTFNAGTKWASSGLGEAARRGDLDAVRERFVQYTKAGGKDMPGLVTRRLAEVTWIGSAGAAGAPVEVPQLNMTAAPPPARTSQTGPSPMSEVPKPRVWPAIPPSLATAFALTIAALELATPRRAGDERAADASSINSEMHG